MTEFERYQDAMKAMQDGVFWEEAAGGDVDPKAALEAMRITHAVLVGLMIEKGLLTSKDFMTRVANAMEADNRRQTAVLNSNGITVQLHPRPGKETSAKSDRDVA